MPAQVRTKVEDRDRRFVSGRVSMRAAAAARAGGAAPSPVIDGYGALFNTETVIGSPQWGFIEVIDPACFDGALTRDDVRALFNHDPNLILGRNTAKPTPTLRLSVDATGLKYEIDPPDTSYSTDLQESIRRGDVTGSSFTFVATKEEWTYSDKPGELPVRRVLECELYDVAPVTFPAYEETSVSMSARSAAAAQREGRSVPANVSMKKANPDEAWSKPSLSDFTDKQWNELSSSEKTHIAGHYAWKGGDSFSDLLLPHHRSQDGAVVLRGVIAAAGRLDATDGITDKAAVRAHLEAHYHQFGEKAPWEEESKSARYRELKALLGQTSAAIDELLASDAAPRDMQSGETTGCARCHRDCRCASRQGGQCGGGCETCFADCACRQAGAASESKAAAVGATVSRAKSLDLARQLESID